MNKAFASTSYVSGLGSACGYGNVTYTCSDNTCDQALAGTDVLTTTPYTSIRCDDTDKCSVHLDLHDGQATQDITIGGGSTAVLLGGCQADGMVNYPQGNIFDPLHKIGLKVTSNQNVTTTWCTSSTPTGLDFPTNTEFFLDGITFDIIGSDVATSCNQKNMDLVSTLQKNQK